MIMDRPCGRESTKGAAEMAVVVTVAKGYDLGYVWKNQAQAGAEQTTLTSDLDVAVCANPQWRATVEVTGPSVTITAPSRLPPGSPAARSSRGSRRARAFSARDWT